MLMFVLSEDPSSFIGHHVSGLKRYKQNLSLFVYSYSVYTVIDLYLYTVLSVLFSNVL